MSLYDDICDLLMKNGFSLQQVQFMDDPTEAVFHKPRAGGASIYVTVPLHCEHLPKSVINRILNTAGIPETNWIFPMAVGQDEET